MSVKLEIEVTQAADQDNGQDQPKNPETKEDDAAIKRSAVKTNILMSMGRRTVGYATNRIGYWTGNSQLQDDINSAMSVVSMGAAIIANPALGIAMAAFSLATQAIDQAQKVKWENRQAVEYQRRSGNYLVNRSRGES